MKLHDRRESISHSVVLRPGTGGDEMEISFECKKCRKEFHCEMGKIGINEQTLRPDFERPIICPHCGIKTMDEVLLTELGQSQMTEATMDL